MKQRGERGGRGTSQGAKGSGEGPGSGPAGEPRPQFEEAIQRLEELVERLEAGEMALEETIATFEEGQKLLRVCSELLDGAELRVKEILRRADGEVEEREREETEDDAS